MKLLKKVAVVIVGTVMATAASITSAEAANFQLSGRLENGQTFSGVFSTNPSATDEYREEESGSYTLSSWSVEVSGVPGSFSSSLPENAGTLFVDLSVSPLYKLEFSHNDYPFGFQVFSVLTVLLQPGDSVENDSQPTTDELLKASLLPFRTFEDGNLEYSDFRSSYFNSSRIASVSITQAAKPVPEPLTPVGIVIAGSLGGWSLKSKRKSYSRKCQD